MTMEKVLSVSLTFLIFILDSHTMRSRTCPLSRQCDCIYKPYQTDIFCDIAKRGRPWFNSSYMQETQRSVTVLGSHSLPDFFFSRLRVRNVRLRGLNLTSTGCSLLFGLEAVLKELDLSNNALWLVPVCTLRGMNRLQSLNLSANRITKLNRQDFALVPSLTKLDLSGNQISQLPDGAFAGLSRLVFLSVSRNMLTGGFETVATSVLTRLETLNLSGNRLVNFGNSIMRIPALKYLYLGDNFLSTFALWNSVRNIKVLSLRKNRLEKLYEHVFAHYSALEDLDLSENRLTSIPFFIWSLPSLGRMNMAKNQLEYLDFHAIPNTKMFSLLDFSHNVIKTVSQDPIFVHQEFELNLAGNKLHNLSSVTVSCERSGNTSINIDLSSNQLKSAPYFRFLRTFDGVNSARIDLSYNSIESVEKLFIHTALRSARTAFITCILKNNRIQHLPPCYLPKTYSFTLMDLSYNLLKEVPAGYCIGYAVKELVLDFNHIENIKQLVFGVNYSTNTLLERVSLVGNQISSIDADAFVHLSESLSVVDLRQNSLMTVPPNIFTMPLLEELNLVGNPLNCECSKGLQLIRTRDCKQVLDNSRCMTPAKARGFLLKCVWRFCSNSCFQDECSYDQFVEVQANVSRVETGFMFKWQLYGPGKWSQIRLNITRDDTATPTSIYLLSPREHSYHFTDTKQGRRYEMCIEALSNVGHSLGSLCFQNVTYSNSKPQNKSPQDNSPGIETPDDGTPDTSAFHVTSLKIGLVVVSIICIICIIVIIVYLAKRWTRQRNRRSRLGGGESHSATGRRVFDSLFPCFKPKKHEGHHNLPVAFSDLLSNDCHRASEGNASEPTTPCPVEQPLLPLRNSYGDDGLERTRRFSKNSTADDQVSSMKPRSCKESSLSSPEKGTVEWDKLSKEDDAIGEKKSSKNLYESEFSLRVKLDDLRTEFDGSDEHIYEDTAPLENHVKPRRTPQHQLDSEKDSKVKGSPVNSATCGTKPSAIVSPVIKRGTNFCDGASGGYECPRTIQGVAKGQSDELLSGNDRQSDCVSEHSDSSDLSEPREMYCNRRYLGNPIYHSPGAMGKAATGFTSPATGGVSGRDATDNDFRV